MASGHVGNTSKSYAALCIVWIPRSHLCHRYVKKKKCKQRRFLKNRHSLSETPRLQFQYTVNPNGRFRGFSGRNSYIFSYFLTILWLSPIVWSCPRNVYILEVKNRELFKKYMCGRLGYLKKYGFAPKKFGMESFDGFGPCLTSVNRSESIFFTAEKANSVWSQTLNEPNLGF